MTIRVGRRSGRSSKKGGVRLRAGAPPRAATLAVTIPSRARGRMGRNAATSDTRGAAMRERTAFEGPSQPAALSPPALRGGARILAWVIWITVVVLALLVFVAGLP